jgi:formylmethanofuran dehydrogenase subunit E
VESKDVVGQPLLETLNTGKLVVVVINGKQKRATVVMASSEFEFIDFHWTPVDNFEFFR